MGARPWLSMTLIMCDTRAACSYGPRGGQFYTVEDVGATQQNIWGIVLRYPSSSYHLTLFLRLLCSHEICSQTGLNEVRYLVSVRYIVKNWRPAFKLVSSQSGLSYSDNPSLVNSNWLNGTLLWG